MLCPPRWACLRSCLPPCLPSGLGCCVRLAGLVFLLSAGLSPVLSAILAGMLCPPRWAVSGLVSQLVSYLVWDALSASLVLSFSCLWSCLPAFVFVLSRSLSFIWDAVSAPPGLVFFLSLVLSPSLSPTWSGMLCSFLARLPAQLVSGLLSHPVFQLVWCVRALGLSPKFHVRFVQLFGVYGGIIFFCVIQQVKSLHQSIVAWTLIKIMNDDNE